MGELLGDDGQRVHLVDLAGRSLYPPARAAQYDIERLQGVLQAWRKRCQISSDREFEEINVLAVAQLVRPHFLTAVARGILAGQVREAIYQEVAEIWEHADQRTAAEASAGDQQELTSD